MGGSGMVGSWVFHTNEMKPCDLPQEVATAFSKATQGMVGVKYVPVLYVASQLVAGTNYCIICAATSATNPPINNCKAMHIYADLHGNATITRIESIVE